MFKLGDTVVDINGRPYLVLASVSLDEYETLDEDGRLVIMATKSLACADEVSIQALRTIAEKVKFVEGILHDIKSSRDGLFDALKRLT